MIGGELVAAARIAEPDGMTAVRGQAVRLHRLAGKRAHRVDAFVQDRVGHKGSPRLCRSGAADVGVGLAFLAERRHRPVAGHERRVVAERPQLRGDRGDQLIVIPLGEIRAPDRSLEQHVADERDAGFGLVKHHMAGGVSRTVIDAERCVAELDRIAADQPAVGFERPAAGKAVLRG